MFGALRRCPAALSRNLSATAISSRILHRSTLQSSGSIRLSSSRPLYQAASALHQSPRWQQSAAASQQVEDVRGEEDGLVTKFKDLATRGLVHPNIVNTITKSMRLTDMTDVQSRTINEALSGADVIAQAKTGTGKTLAFLIPIIQRIIQNDPKLGERSRGYKRAKPDDIRAIVISPTRELAEQIATEAMKVTQGTGIVVQTAVGGTQKRMMLHKTQREGCHLLIGTPGRLNDILSDPYSGVKAPSLNALVMDEADRLLDDGFQQEIDDIKQHLPDPEEVERQTLMFSATVPRNVVELVRRTLKPGFHFARCVNENEEPTHQRVPQKVVQVNGFENIMPTIYELVQKELERSKAPDARPFKAIIYFNSTSEVTLAASVFYKLCGRDFKRQRAFPHIKAFEIHSKLSQAQRTRAADDFRFAKSAILFSSDVTARGMDFPDVTHVIQIGLPRDRESYIHRIGRTGRAGKEGEGWLVTIPLEQREMAHRLHNLPLIPERSLEAAKFDMTEQGEVPEKLATILNDVADAYKKVYPDQLDAAFKALFGAYQWCRDRDGLLQAANRLAEFGWGMPPPNPPSAFMMNMSRSRSNTYGSRRDSGSQMGDRYGNDRGREYGRRGFGDRREGGFGDRRQGGFGDRRQGGFGDRREGGFGDRREGGWGGRGKTGPKRFDYGENQQQYKSPF